jgi:hypothetical protein
MNVADLAEFPEGTQSFRAKTSRDVGKIRRYGQLRLR